MGGIALHPAARDLSLRVSALVRGLPALELPETRATFADVVGGFAPPDYQALIHNLGQEHRQPSLKVLLSLLRLGEWDHQIIFAYGNVLTQLAKTATRGQNIELLAAPAQGLGALLPDGARPALRAGAHLRAPRYAPTRSSSWPSPFACSGSGRTT